MTFTASDGLSEDSKTIPITVVTKPDLTPTEILYDSNKLIEGQTVLFDSGITNLGEAGTNLFNVLWKVDEQEFAPEDQAWHDPVLGGTTVLDGNSQFSWTAEAGTHTISFIVDSDNNISESDETNNATEVTVNVTVDKTPPVITITSPTYGATVPSTGFEFTGKAEDASGVEEVRIYIYDYGRYQSTVSNQLANYEASTQTWSFSVGAEHITPGSYAYLYVRAKDINGNWTYYQSVRVNVSNP